eukprot:scaffold39077_cov24-Tisochrysis_lutea.AAC.1
MLPQKTSGLPDEPMDCTRMALEIAMDHMRPDTCRMVVTDECFTRHSSTLLTILTHGCHPPTSLSQALGIRLTISKR